MVKWPRNSKKVCKMARILNALTGGADGGVFQISGGLLLLCAVVVSLSILSMIVFACLDDPDDTDSGRRQRRRRHAAHAAHMHHQHAAHAAHMHHHDAAHMHMATNTM
ncbi:unnamed protein product [Ilex paraguariensis]|uniref:Uncharacterized protein n=1 Tax=Ilex paraguariensis TaxID=185542 RepID=A0ABC8QUT4_9AQUA